MAIEGAQAEVAAHLTSRAIEPQPRHSRRDRDAHVGEKNRSVPRAWRAFRIATMRLANAIS
jgi:hypothetical protein